MADQRELTWEDLGASGYQWKEGEGSGATWTDPSGKEMKQDEAVAALNQSQSSAPSQRTYTVASGDTLSAIAERFYGDANAYTRIFEANRDKLDNPDMIRAGQELVIPT